MVKQRPIHPVILCGGSGTRLWPASRKTLPKPFLPLIGDQTLFEQAVERVKSSANGRGASFASPTIVAGTSHIELIEQQMGAAKHRLIVEPSAKNTAPAIALAAACMDPSEIMLVCPSDHHIADVDAFRSAALTAAQLADQGYLVSFGIAPDHPETGYGYLHHGEELPGGFTVARFVEKPDRAHAQAYLASGDYSWNGGIFAFRAGQLLDELAAHRPAVAQSVLQAVEEGRTEGMRFYPDSGLFGAIDGESIDYAVMENTGCAAMVPVDMGWSDIGNWAALQDALRVSSTPTTETEGGGNIGKGNADFIDCGNVLASTDGPRISAVGLNDICIIVCDGEVLVTTRDGAQLVGTLPGASDQ